jgi:RimJ/RimL family protein N-acetyltransferase
MTPSGAPKAVVLTTERLLLEPLSVDHVDELAPLLDDVRLHHFTGGAPADVAALRSLVERQVVGHSPDGSEEWLNWVARRRVDGRAVGTLQAGVSVTESGPVAAVAWVTAVPHQGQGYAKEGAQAVADHLRSRGRMTLVAYVHPGHIASMAVARSIGLQATDVVVDGEVCWSDAGTGSIGPGRDGG